MKGVMEQVVELLARMEHKLCVLSTISPLGKPQSAVMGFVMQKDGTMIFNTDRRSRKWANIGVNPSVAITVGWDMRDPFVQMEGIATRIGEGQLYKTYEEAYFIHHPNSLSYKGKPETVFIAVYPTWVRYNDMTVTPHNIEEVTLNPNE